MLYLIQSDYEDGAIDNLIIQDLIEKKHFDSMYIGMTFDDMKQLTDKFIQEKSHLGTVSAKDAVPIGSIQFVSEYFSKVYNIKAIMNLEVPLVLQKDEFLHREYSIVKGSELPKSGEYFIKDATAPKTFSYCGNLEYMKDSSFKQEDICNEHLYVLSKVLDIKAEYRVYIFDGKVQAIINYNGDPFIFPDTKVILKADAIYRCSNEYPSAYTMDIMVTPEGTSIIECHVLFSCGLYNTIWGTSLLYGYQQAKRYILEKSKKCQKCYTK